MFREPPGIARRSENDVLSVAGVVLDSIWRRDDRHAAGHGFERLQRRALVPATENEEMCAPVQIGEVMPKQSGVVADVRDPGSNARRSRPKRDESHIRTLLGHDVKGVDYFRVALPVAAITERHHDGRPGKLVSGRYVDIVLHGGQDDGWSPTGELMKLLRQPRAVRDLVKRKLVSELRLLPVEGVRRQQRLVVLHVVEAKTVGPPDDRVCAVPSCRDVRVTVHDQWTEISHLIVRPESFVKDEAVSAESGTASERAARDQRQRQRRVEPAPHGSLDRPDSTDADVVSALPEAGCDLEQHLDSAADVEVREDEV